VKFLLSELCNSLLPGLRDHDYCHCQLAGVAVLAILAVLARVIKHDRYVMPEVATDYQTTTTDSPVVTAISSFVN